MPSNNPAGDTVRQWSPLLCSSRELLNVCTANSPQSLIFKISSMACAHNIMFVGGFQGEFACRRLDDMEAPVHYGITTTHSNGIANHIHITEGPRGGEMEVEREFAQTLFTDGVFPGVKAIVSSNDKNVRYINMENITIETALSFPFAVNVGF